MSKECIHFLGHSVDKWPVSGVGRFNIRENSRRCYVPIGDWVQPGEVFDLLKKI